jgi:hypothetical protein
MNDITEGAVVQRETMPVASNNSAALMQIIERAASSPDFNVERLNALLDVKERWDKNEARKAFDSAMASAKAEIPVITKDRVVDFTNKTGQRTYYQYEDLASIARAIDPILGKNGLSYRFRTTATPNEPVTVTCIVAHRDGHVEENTLCAGRDDSGNKNSIQAIGSTLTYLQRMTLKAALGLAAAADDDGSGAGSGSSEDAGMPEKQYLDFQNAVDGAADEASLQTLWEKIVTAANAANDKHAYDTLKERVKQRKAALKKPKETA